MLKMASKTHCSVVVIGDAKTGKSSLIHSLKSNKFNEEYTPTSFDKVLAELEVEKHHVQFTLWDTSGSPAYDSIRSLAYQEADVFLICYKITDPISLYNAKNKWIVEIRKHRPIAPVVLCGCMADLRADLVAAAALAKTGRAPVSREQGLAICCEIGAVNFVETSAASSTDVQEAFEVCALASLSRTTTTLDLISARNSKPKVSISNSEGSNTVSSKKSFGGLSTSSSLSKKMSNVSFSGSESNADDTSLPRKSAVFGGTKITFFEEDSGSLNHNEEEDVFPNHQSRPMQSTPIKSEPSVSRQQDAGNLSSRTPELNFRHPNRLSSAVPANILVSPNANRRSVIDIVSPLTSPTALAAAAGSGNAQVRPNGLSRRTSFRSSSGGHPPKAVSTPKSPPLSPGIGIIQTSPELIDSSPQVQDSLSPLAVSTRKLPPRTNDNTILPTHDSLAAFVDMKHAKGESLKSHTSNVSRGSTGSSSKTSTVSSSLGSTGSMLAQARCRDIIDPDVPDTEDPELLSHLQFVSPKNGVFRPINHNSSGGGISSSPFGKSIGCMGGGGSGGKRKPNCRMM